MYFNFKKITHITFKEEFIWQKLCLHRETLVLYNKASDTEECDPITALIVLNKHKKGLQTH